MCDSDKSGKNKKGDEDMLAHADKISSQNALRKPKIKRTNLLSSSTDETFKTMNEISKKQRGLSNLTYKKLFGEE